MEYVKIKGKEYPAQIIGFMEDPSWDRRESKTIIFSNNAITYKKVMDTFVDGAEWSIISEWQEELFDEEGKPFDPPQFVTHRDEFDNSDFSLAGEVCNKRDGGTITVKMGKLTDLESLIEDIYGGGENK